MLSKYHENNRLNNAYQFREIIDFETRTTAEAPYNENDDLNGLFLQNVDHTRVI